MAKKAFIFPGQGAQYPGMGKDFFDNFAVARHTFEEANDVLKRDLTSIIFSGPEDTLTATHNSQVAIYTTSIAMLRVIHELFPDFQPQVTSGLSLGEYTALTAAGKLSFESGLQLVEERGKLMSHACETTQGTMAVVLGLSAEEVEAVVAEVNMPNDLWAANFNCPGQVVISGTLNGIKAGTEAMQKRGAKRVLPLKVHGAFHSGLMVEAEKELARHVLDTTFHKASAKCVMNVPGDFVEDLAEMKANLIRQVTSPVRWEQGVRAMDKAGVTLYVEIGCGKTLSGFNRKMNVSAPTVSVEKVEELEKLKEFV